MESSASALAAMAASSSSELSNSLNSTRTVGAATVAAGAAGIVGATAVGADSEGAGVGSSMLVGELSEAAEVLTVSVTSPNLCESWLSQSK